MQMHDALRRTQEGTSAAELAAAFDVAPEKAAAAMRAVASGLAWHLEKNTLSRGGLADLVEALGGRHHAKHLGGGTALRDEAVRVDGNAILGHILGSKDRSRALAARAARAAGLSDEAVRSMLPALAAITMARLAARSKDNLGEVLRVMPPLGSWSRGGPHADLADILRRRCGAGPYAQGKLRRVVRRALARAGGFRPRGPVRWYAHFMLTPIAAPMRWVVARLVPTR